MQSQLTWFIGCTIQHRHRDEHRANHTVRGRVDQSDVAVSIDLQTRTAAMRDIAASWLLSCTSCLSMPQPCWQSGTTDCTWRHKSRAGLVFGPQAREFTMHRGDAMTSKYIASIIFWSTTPCQLCLTMQFPNL